MLTEGQTGLAAWHIVFYLTAGILIIEAVVYTLLGSGELQQWNSADVQSSGDAEKNNTPKK